MMSDPIVIWMVACAAALGALVALIRFLARDVDGERASLLAVDRDVPIVDEPLHTLRFRTEWEANAAAARLTEAGIDAVPSGGLTASQHIDMVAYASVLIPESARLRAEALLAAPVEIDWTAVDVGELDDDLRDAPPPCCDKCGGDLSARHGPACPACGARLD